MNPIEYLDAHKVVYATNNGGAHLVVEGRHGYIDYWPGTGKWKDRNGGDGFGATTLVEHIQGASAVSVELSLLPNEALWLRGLLQNPVGNTPHETESATDSDYRVGIFHKLTHSMQ